MVWSLATTAVDRERDRCCFVQDGERCREPSVVRIAEGSWVGYTYTCSDHARLLLARAPDCNIERLPPSLSPDTEMLAARLGEAIEAANTLSGFLCTICNALITERADLDKLGDVHRAARACEALQRALDYAARCKAMLTAIED